MGCCGVERRMWQSLHDHILLDRDNSERSYGWYTRRSTLLGTPLEWLPNRDEEEESLSNVE